MCKLLQLLQRQQKKSEKHTRDKFPVYYTTTISEKHQIQKNGNETLKLQIIPDNLGCFLDQFRAKRGKAQRKDIENEKNSKFIQVHFRSISGPFLILYRIILSSFKDYYNSHLLLRQQKRPKNTLRANFRSITHLLSFTKSLRYKKVPLQNGKSCKVKKYQ